MDDAQNKSSDQTAGGQYDPAVTLTDAGVMDILERVSDALYIIDEQWCLTYLNRKAEQLWGRRRDNLLGKISGRCSGKSSTRAAPVGSPGCRSGRRWLAAV